MRLLRPASLLLSTLLPMCNSSPSAPVDAGGDATTPTADGGASPGDAATPPPGPIGVTTRTWMDTTRPTPANGTEPEHPSRTLVTEIWYPTTAAAAAGAASPVRDAPLAAGGPYPLVLFVHGSGGGRTNYTYLTGGLAGLGYVVAAADFPLTALTTPGGSSDLHVTDEVGDLSFLCDQLKTASQDAGDALSGAVTGMNYAVVGHSTGGAVGELAAFAGNDSLVTHDPRVAAVVALSGDACMFDASFFKTRPVPIFAIGASNDLFVRIANSGQWVYESSNEPHLLANIIGGQHLGFTDLPIPDAVLNPVPTDPTSPLAVTLQPYGDAGACLPEPAPGTDPAITGDQQHAIVIELVNAYLSAELRGDPTRLAAVEAASDPLVVIQK